MRNLILILLYLPIVAIAQDQLLDILPLKSSRVTYTSVFIVEGLSKEQIIDRSKVWFINNHVKDYLVKDIDEKHLMINGKSSIKALWGANDYKELYTDVYFTIEIMAKNERYQYKINNFIVRDPGKETQLEIYKMDQHKYNTYNKIFYEHIDKEVKELINSLTRQMNPEQFKK